MTVGDAATAQIDSERRQEIRRNHTATHLLHKALRQVVGEDTRQAGSLVAPDRLRFDFTALEPVSDNQLRTIAEIVNRQVISDTPVETEVLPFREAVEQGAVALFGEKYGDMVRVVSIDTFSKELCGGTHVRNTGEIGPFVITSESSVASGVRRIEALTGTAAIQRMIGQQRVVEAVGRDLKVSWTDLRDQVHSLQERIRQQDREIAALSGIDVLRRDGRRRDPEHQQCHQRRAENPEQSHSDTCPFHAAHRPRPNMAEAARVPVHGRGYTTRKTDPDPAALTSAHRGGQVSPVGWAPA